MLSGGTLFGEAILTVSLIALGGALTFLLAARLSSSRALGLLAAVAAISIGPRLYGYPKVFLFVLALACAWRYVQDRSTIRLFVVATVTAVAWRHCAPRCLRRIYPIWPPWRPISLPSMQPSSRHK